MTGHFNLGPDIHNPFVRPAMIADPAPDPKATERVRFAIVDPNTRAVLRFGYCLRMHIGTREKQNHEHLVELASDHPHPADMVYDPTTNSLTHLQEATNG